MTQIPGWPPIPGETPVDPSGLKARGVRTRNELDIVEAKNVLKATTKYLQGRISAKRAPFDDGWVFRLHKEMFGDVWKWADKQRTTVLNLGCKPHQIAEQIVLLLGDLHCWSSLETPMPILEQAARLHHRSVLIHPFENGNGRWSRLLANIWLHRAGLPYIEWPSETTGKACEIRDQYLAALKQADGGDYGPLLTLQERFVLPESF